MVVLNGMALARQDNGLRLPMRQEDMPRASLRQDHQPDPLRPTHAEKSLLRLLPRAVRAPPFCGLERTTPPETPSPWKFKVPVEAHTHRGWV